MAPMGSMVVVNRPRLTVQIPDDDRSDEEETAAAGSSSGSGGTITTGGGGGRAGGMPTSATTLVPREGGQVVLPPPSPSAGALLSAGAHGPPNPFARPNPPPSMTTAATSGNSIETPISALPSRIAADGGLITSPNTYFGHEWGFGRGMPANNGGGPGPNDFNLLPSPINLPTPLGVMPPTTAGGPHALNFDRDRNRAGGVGGLKRKSPELMETTSADDVTGQVTRVAGSNDMTGTAIPTSVAKKIKI